MRFAKNAFVISILLHEQGCKKSVWK